MGHQFTAFSDHDYLTFNRISVEFTVSLQALHQFFERFTENYVYIRKLSVILQIVNRVIHQK